MTQTQQANNSRHQPAPHTLLVLLFAPLGTQEKSPQNKIGDAVVSGDTLPSTKKAPVVLWPR